MYALKSPPTLQTFTQKALDLILNRIPTQGISEIELASKTGLEAQDVRERLESLANLGLAKEDEDNEGFWFKSDRGSISVIPEIEYDNEDETHLSSQERSDLITLEQKIYNGFYLAGKALEEICSRRLYREHFKNFEAYCKSKLGINARTAYLKIAGSQVCDNLQKYDQFDRISILPNNIHQTRQLMELEPEDQALVWNQLLQENNYSRPTGSQIKEAVDLFKEQQYKAPNPFSDGDVVTTGRDWWIVTEARDHSCVCRNWQKEEVFHYSHLKNYLPDFAEEIRKTQLELWTLWEQSNTLKKADRIVAQQLLNAIANNLECGTKTGLQENLITALQCLMEGDSND